MAKKKVSSIDFPYSELEFTKPADALIEAVKQHLVRIQGEKPVKDVVLAICNLVLENRK